MRQGERAWQKRSFSLKQTDTRPATGCSFSRGQRRAAELPASKHLWRTARFRPRRPRCVFQFTHTRLKHGDKDARQQAVIYQSVGCRNGRHSQTWCGWWSNRHFMVGINRKWQVSFFSACINQGLNLKGDSDHSEVYCLKPHPYTHTHTCVVYSLDASSLVSRIFVSPSLLNVKLSSYLTIMTLRRSLHPVSS